MRGVFVCSLLALLSALGFGVDYKKLARDLEGAKTVQDVRQATKEIVAVDPEFQALVDSIVLSSFDKDLANLRMLVRSLILREAVQARTERKTGADDPAKMAKRIKQEPFYRDQGDAETSNWLSNALTRLLNLFRGRSQAPDVPDLPNVNGNWLAPVAWGILGIAVAVFLYFVLRHVRWRTGLKRKARAGLLDEDEEQLSGDQWLERARALRAEGRHRDAVRCLYLACLLRLDEYRVARFDRGETNWEHLRRIEASPLRPTEVDFRYATRRFDQVWYGMMVRGESDVDEFERFYSEMMATLTQPKAVAS